MKLNLKSTLVFIFVLVIWTLILAKSVQAASVSVQALDDNNNPINKLDENTAKAKITFTNLLDNTYEICLGWGSRPEDRDCAKSVTINRSDIVNGQASIIVCGDKIGGGVFKIPSETLYPDLPGLKTSCDKDDFFHAHDYAFEIRPNGGQKIKYERGVQVEIYNPEIALSPLNPKDSDKINVVFTGSRRPAKRKDRNEYKFELSRDDKQLTPEKLKNLTVSESGQASFEFGPLQKGDYTLKIIRTNLDGRFDDKAKANDGVVAIFYIRTDPNGGSISGGTTGSGTKGENPCKIPDPNNPGKFLCPTALGNIPTDIQGFAGRILAIAIGLAGGLALILMVIGSVRVLTSSGDQQKLAGGRDMIVAAVAGLLFLIFSVLILRFIGIQILNL